MVQSTPRVGLPIIHIQNYNKTTSGLTSTTCTYSVPVSPLIHIRTPYFQPPLESPTSKCMRLWGDIYIPVITSRMTGSCGSFIYSFWRKLCSVFLSGCRNLYSQQQCIDFILTYFLPSICYFLIIAILTGITLICISLMANHSEHFFMYLKTICF